MKDFFGEYTLSNSDIVAMTRATEDYLSKYQVASRERSAILLKLEEALVFYQEKFGASHTANLKLSYGWNKKISVFVEGEQAKPFEAGEDEYLENLRRMVGEYDGYQYKHKTNILEFKKPKRHFSQPIQLLIAVAVALICTYLFKLLPAEAVLFIKDSVLGPLVDVILGVIRGIASVLIFTSIALGIVGIGDMNTFRKMGKSLLSSAFGWLLLLGGVGVAVFLPWMQFAEGAKADFARVFENLYQVILGVIPSDPLSPFIEGNALQIIVLALVFGIIGAMLGSRVKEITAVASELNLVMSKALEAINGGLPLVVFIILLYALAGNDSSVFGDSVTFMLLWAVGLAVLFLFNCIVICTVGRMNLVDYFKKAKAPLLTALFTSSAMAAYAQNMECCKKELKISQRILNLDLPIGQIVYMPADLMLNLASCIGVAHLAGMSVSADFLIVVVVSAMLLAIASPPIPGSLLITSTMLFSQLGLPESYLGIILAVICLFNFPATFLNVQAMHGLLLKENRKKF